MIVNYMLMERLLGENMRIKYPTNRFDRPPYKFDRFKKYSFLKLEFEKVLRSKNLTYKIQYAFWIKSIDHLTRDTK